jgi:Protein of unknown function (DUF541)
MLISVRGEARQVVPPDSATMTTTVQVTRDSKAEAVRTAAAYLDRLTGDLAGLGGVALEPGTERDPLTWSANSMSTRLEHTRDERTGDFEPTGKVISAVDVLVTVRAFERLDRLGAALAAHETVSVQHVQWHVDWDNPAWQQVRAAAIQAAVRKGGDYAAALGGSVTAVEHIADAGLLGGDNQHHVTGATAAFGRASRGRGGEDSGVPSLDPVPQELTAIIEARLSADTAPLPRRGQPQGRR